MQTKVISTAHDFSLQKIVNVHGLLPNFIYDFKYLVCKTVLAQSWYKINIYDLNICL